MTAIAGFIDQGRVWIGGDSAGVSDLDLTVRSDPKVFRNGEFLFGFTSSFRMGQLLRYKFKPAIHGSQDAYEYMVTSFVDGVRECLKAGGYARRDRDEEEGGVFLVGYRGQLFRVDNDYNVGEPRDGYDACGCGQALVRGALFATQGLGMTPERRMRTALDAAEHHSAGVRGPFVIESVWPT